ncbi:MAG: right-handed parallel beta-helix repeat-containing protein, partial [Candidatus Lokiarchaeota archaeon]|nr:right-handed parallel beta-helix repeat-containing protein [Candidatus Lokiarchaeota archaeon]
MMKKQNYLELRNSTRLRWIRRNRKLELLFFAFLVFVMSCLFLRTSLSGSDHPSTRIVEETVTSDYWVLTDPIVINDMGSNNWAWARTQAWCTKGDGSEGNPYIIENVTINGGSLTSCIEIKYSSAHFIVRNCTLYNSGKGFFYAGIKLTVVSNGQIINNNCSYNGGSGITLHQDSMNNLINDNVANNNSYIGISLETNCDGNVITANTVDKNDRGIYLDQGCNNNEIAENIVLNNSYGFFIYYNCDDNVLLSNTANNNSYGIYQYNCDNNIISGNTAEFNDEDGIYINGYNNTISNNDVSYNTRGIKLTGFTNNNVIDNEVNDNQEYGINIVASDNNMLIGNTIKGSNYGIYSWSSTDNLISGNELNNSIFYTMRICDCSRTIVSDNTLSVHGDIDLSSCVNATVKKNSLNNCGINLRYCQDPLVFENEINGDGFFVYGSIVDLATHEINTTNKINGKPAYYYVNEIGLGSNNFTNAGQIIMINCSNSVLSDQNITNTSAAIYMYSSSHNIISGNRLEDNYEGIYLHENCEYNVISDNTINKNYYSVYQLYYSVNNSIFDNEITNNHFGIYLQKGGENFTISGNNISFNDWYGLRIDNARHIVVSENHIHNNLYGLDLSNIYDNSIIAANIACNNERGISIHGHNNIVWGNKINNSYWGLTLSTYNSSILGNIARNNSYGIQISHRNNNTVSGNTAIENEYGFYLIEADDNIISGNMAIGNTYGFYTYTACKNSISGNTVINGSIGISLDCSSNKNIIAANEISNISNRGIFLCQESNNNTISENTLSYNTNYGIEIYRGCYNNNITGNVMNNNKIGVRLYSCRQSILHDNSIIGGGLLVSGEIDDLKTHSIDTSNLINGKKLYYYVNEIGLNESNFDNAGQVILINSSYCVISQQNMTNTYYAIYLQSSSHNIISNNYMGNNSRGIYLYRSCYDNTFLNNIVCFNSEYGIYLLNECQNNNIINNTVSSNGDYGIYLYTYCDNNTILGNIASYNYRGIYLEFNDDNNVLKNQVIKNIDYGIYLFFCEDSTISQNSIIENGMNARDDSGDNQWDNGSVGNYWSDYTGVDEIEPFGIGDTPYNIYGNTGAQDKYPIIIGIPLNADFTVNITSLIEGEWVQFTYTGSSGIGQLNYSWNFGDGTPELTTTTLTTSHSYTIAGIYTVTLNVSDANGDWDEEVKLFYITVLEAHVDIFPEADFYANATTINEGDIVQFTFNGTEGNTPPLYSWNFGDGTPELTTTTPTTSHTYAIAGIYTVKLNVTDANGDWDEEVKLFYVTVLEAHVNILPEADFYANATTINEGDI